MKQLGAAAFVLTVCAIYAQLVGDRAANAITIAAVIAAVSWLIALFTLPEEPRR